MALPAWALVTLDEAKRHLRVEYPDDDALIERLIMAATRYVEQATGCRFVQQMVDELYDGDDARPRPYSFRPWERATVLPLRWQPVAAVQRVEIAGQPVTDYQVDSAGGRLIRVSGWPSGRANIRVVYTAGYGANQADAASLVPDVVQSVLLLVGHWYANREAAQTGTVATEIRLGVDNLLAPYRRRVAVL